MKIFDDSVYIDILRNRLTDPFSLAKARIHPLNLLMTWKTYSSGHGQKGQLAWNVKSRVKYILEDAFYLLFKSLDEVLREINGMNFGATDCALPMIYARERKIPADAFIVYTDNETWRGKTHPFQALKDYRAAMGIDAKLIVVGNTATKFSIANPSDAGMLDVVGFDSAVPQIVGQFVEEG